MGRAGAALDPADDNGETRIAHWQAATILNPCPSTGLPHAEAARMTVGPTVELARRTHMK